MILHTMMKAPSTNGAKSLLAKKHKMYLKMGNLLREDVVCSLQETIIISLSKGYGVSSFWEKKFNY